MDNKRIQELEEKIADLKKRWPAHSVPPAMVQELDDLEEELAEALEQVHQEKDHA
jgi:cell division protein ZapA (FtsZ GTPase activity inhibitor)